ncbi:MAG: 50S ribosomal protein L25 [Patescibacteria group bacterium]
MSIALQYEKRDPKVAPSTLRNAGKIPAVFYGRKQASTSITLSAKEFEKVWKKAGENTPVTLQGPEGEVETLIHEVARHPVTGDFRHADFYAFEKGQRLHVKIPIEFIGVAPAVKDLGGVLVKVMHELEIEAAPKDLPQKIEVDISPLATFGSIVTAREIKLPAGVILAASADEVVASVYEPKEEAVAEAPADLSTIEVAKKGKEEAAGETAAAAPKAGDAAGPLPKSSASGQAAFKKEEKREEKKGERKQ